MTERRRFWRWLAILLSISGTNFAIGFGAIDFGFCWVNVIVVMFICAVFIVVNAHDSQARAVMATGARPRKGYIVHADGSQTAVHFVMLGEGQFAPVTLDGEHVNVRPGDRVKFDQIAAGQRIVLYYKD